MSTNKSTDAEPVGLATSLPHLVMEIRARLGPGATPEQVAAEIRASGIRMATEEEVRQVWGTGDPPVE